MKSLTEKQLREILQVAYEQGREDQYYFERGQSMQKLSEEKNKLFDKLISEA